jgi:hypothetical protein
MLVKDIISFIHINGDINPKDESKALKKLIFLCIIDMFGVFT